MASAPCSFTSFSEESSTVPWTPYPVNADALYFPPLVGATVPGPKFPRIIYPIQSDRVELWISSVANAGGANNITFVYGIRAMSIVT